MRILFFLLSFTSLSVFAQVDPGTGADGACTGATITGGAAVYNCATLTISAGNYNFPQNPAPIVRVKVQGDVTIASGVTLDLSGDDGVSDTTEAQPGAFAGAGGEDGGGNNAGPEDAPTGGALQGVSNAACGGGGGGGGFTNVGSAGATCGFGGGAGGNFHDITILFRGGFGGGAGGLGDFGAPLSTGTGGGGGGALWISAGGNITINGSIDVSGGNGGNGLVKSGGGGGGSGGAIRIQSSGDIVNNAVFNIAGGSGGNGHTTGARGGNGSVGVFQFEDADNVVFGTGTGATAFPGSSESFNSSITCGAVKMKDDQHLFQMIAGFMLVILISKILGRNRRLV